MTQSQVDLARQKKARLFHDLHHSGQLLILPNIWDPLGALLLADLSFPAVATASAAVAFTNGYDDGENIPLTSLLALLRKIVDSVTIPVSADIESGFADNNGQLKENIKRLLETGIAGINIEDVDKKTNALWSTEIQSEKIALIKQVSLEAGVPLFINARSDVYIRGKGFDSPEAKLEESLRRGTAYKAAGADCFYPITMHRPEDIKITVAELKMPINVLVMEGIPELSTLSDMGVARVSLGPGFLKIAVQAMKKLATKLQRHEGIADIIKNEITSPYLKGLVSSSR